ncbi:MAG: hypothetical protein GXO47_10180, partial [Chlorobi bacterium]|nr:hypothetical protein [Chlorobiota bacterium]
SIRDIDITQLIQLLESTKKHRINRTRKTYDPLPLPFLNYQTIKPLVKSNTAINYIAQSEKQVAGFLFTLLKYPYAEALLTGINEDFYKKGTSPFLFEYAFHDLKNKGFNSINLGGIPEGKDGENLAIFKKRLGAEEKIVYGATTNFLIYPYKLLNPILNIGRKLPRNNPIVQFLKKFI